MKWPLEFFDGDNGFKMKMVEALGKPESDK
jgi:hypothetical protein